jgi:hypothetical protein
MEPVRARPGRLTPLWLGALLPIPAAADHGAAATAVERAGRDPEWLTLAALGAGVVLVILLAAWALLAPARDEEPDDRTDR